MRERASSTDRRGTRRLVWAAALLGVLALPVQYRGGVDLPHAHAALQLWTDPADGAFDHHAGPYAHPTGGGAPNAGVAVQTRATTVVLAEDADAPRLSPRTLSAERVPLLIAAIVLALPAMAGRRCPVWAPPRAWTGGVPSHETPPPRLAPLDP